jgi:outer membrane receptor protein involved in Fe transport
MKQGTNQFVLSAIALAVLALASQAAQAQSAAPAAGTSTAAAGSDAAELESQNRVVVVGTTSLRRTERESSVAVTVADREDLDRKAPRSMASALELIPGVIVEDSGGEASNNFTVRGLPGGGQNFIQISEDGLPIFYNAGFADQLVKMELSIDRLEAVRGGTSGILTTNGAGATVNFITYKAKSEPEGMIRLTGSNYGTKRIDLRYGGAIGNGWYAGVGGFMRTSNGVRNPGFTADKGGLVRAYIGRQLADGEFSVNLKVVNDHNMFLLPTPFMNPSNPTAVPGFDGNYDTMVSRDNAIQQGHASSGLKENDATDGIQTRSTSIGYDFNKLVATDLTLRAKGRYTDFDNQFNAVFTYDNASLRSAADRLDPAKNVDVQKMLARFPGTTAAMRGVSSGTIYAGANLANVGGNGLVADSINSSQLHAKQNMTNDISLTWTRPNNSLTGGLLVIHQDSQDSSDGNLQFLGEVRNQPSRLDIVALNSAGQVVGQLTDKGVVAYNPWGVGTSKEQLDSTNVYFNDEYKVNDRLRLDAGVRFERLKVRQWNPNGKTITPAGALNANGSDADNIIVNNSQPVWDGTFNTTSKQHSDKSLTAGGNYLVNDNLAAYARWSRSYQAQGGDEPTKITFEELGARYMMKGFSASATYFHTIFNNFNYSRRFDNDNEDTKVHGGIAVNGLEFDLAWRPVRFAELRAEGVYQKADVHYDSVTGPSASKVDMSTLGGKPERSPEVNFTITPSFLLPGNKGEIYASFHQMGKRFADSGNTIVLPAYHTVDLGGRYAITPALSLNVSVQNLTNTIGLTEGNPRSSFTELAGNYFFARSILGRNIQASLTASF